VQVVVRINKGTSVLKIISTMYFKFVYNQMMEIRHKSSNNVRWLMVLSLWGNKIKCMCPKRPIVLPLKKHRVFQKHSTVGNESTRRGTSEGMDIQL
jgi:hypothetical protein